MGSDILCLIIKYTKDCYLLGHLALQYTIHALSSFGHSYSVLWKQRSVNHTVRFMMCGLCLCSKRSAILRAPPSRRE